MIVGERIKEQNYSNPTRVIMPVICCTHNGNKVSTLGNNKK